MDPTELAIVRIPTVAEADEANFAAYLDWLVQSHYTTVSPDEVYDWLMGTADLLPASSVYQQTKPILITFDEGGEDIYNFAFPALVERGMKATVYVVTGFLDGLTTVGPFTESDPLTWDMVREMVASGLITIGTMGRTGADLTALVQDPGEPPPDPRPRTLAEVQNDFLTAKLRVQEETGVDCDHAAYPQGKVDDVVYLGMNLCGFKTCRAYNPYDLTMTYPYGSPRLEMENSPALMLSSYASPAGFPSPVTPVQPPGEELAPLTLPESWSSTSEGWAWVEAGNLFQGASLIDGTRQYLGETVPRYLRKHDTRYYLSARVEATITDGTVGIQVLELDQNGDAIAQPNGSPDVWTTDTSTEGEVTVGGVYVPSGPSVKRIYIGVFSDNALAEINVRDIHMYEAMTS